MEIEYTQFVFLFLNIVNSIVRQLSSVLYSSVYMGSIKYAKSLLLSSMLIAVQTLLFVFRPISISQNYEVNKENEIDPMGGDNALSQSFFKRDCLA